jgi:hypothetical protein
MPSAGGVCWADAPEAAAEQCFACADGEVCVQRDDAQLVCISAGVCAALWDLGVTDVCRYADKGQYDHTPLPEPSGPCPAPGANALCGGACGSCTYARCTGRSPRHPFGVCQELSGVGPALFDTCTLENGVLTTPCPFPSASICGVFDAAPSDIEASKHYGLCAEESVCLKRASSLPGGYLCFDSTGQQIN